jgi:hypothetical protein
MVHTKDLQKGKEYIHVYLYNPEVVKYVGISTDRTKYVKDVPIFKRPDGHESASLRLTEIYDPDRIKTDKKKWIIKTAFEGEHIWRPN